LIYKLSSGEKNLIDTALGLFGGLVGLFVDKTLAIPADGLWLYVNLFLPIIGLAAGYFVSDAIAWVDTGIAPAVVTVEAQAAAVWTQVAKPLVVAEIAKLPAGDQTAANMVMNAVEAKLLPVAQVVVVPVPTAVVAPVVAVVEPVAAVVVEPPK
jgi:hypothetical protein